MKLSLSKQNGVMNVAIRGDLTELAEESLNDLLTKVETADLVINGEKVELINSMGARIWVGFYQELLRRKINVTFKDLSVSFTEACNVYPKFARPGSIQSVRLPVRCEGCASDATIEVNKHSCEDMISSKKVGCCPKCKALWTCEMDLEEYFQSLR